MPIYRHDRLPGGSHYVRRTTWEDEAAGAVVGGAASAAGWVIGSGISGARTLARNSRDRKMVTRAQALTAALEAEDFDTLLVLSSDFVRRYPQQEFGHAQLALALSSKSRLDEALAELELAEQLGLDRFEAHAMRGGFYDAAGNTGKAIQEYTSLMRHPEARPYGLIERAGCLVELGDLDQALDDANEAVAELPDEKSYFVRGNIHRLKGDFEKCLQDYNRAIKLRPDLPDSLECRAEVYEMLGRTDEATEDRSAAVAAQKHAALEDPETGGDPASSVRPRMASPSSSLDSYPRSTKLPLALILVGVLCLISFNILPIPAIASYLALIGAAMILIGAIWWLIIRRSM